MSRRDGGKNPCSRGQQAGTLCAPGWVALTMTSQLFSCSVGPSQTDTFMWCWRSHGADFHEFHELKNMNSMRAMTEQDKQDKRHTIPIPTESTYAIR